MTYHRIDNGPEGRPNLTVESLPLQWPVLARLPWVGDAAQSLADDAPPASPAPHQFGYNASPAGAPLPPALRIAETTTIPPAPSAGRQFSPPAYDSGYSAYGAEAPPAPQPKKQYRIDPGDGRIVAAAISRVNPSTTTTSADSRPSLATRLFQLHSALAPHAGVAITFLLALTAGLLYWRTIGPASLANNPPAAQPLAWATEPGPRVVETEPAVDDWQSPPPAYDVPDMSWPLSPRVTLDATPLTAAVKPPSLESASSLAQELLDKPPSSQPAPKAPAANVTAPEITPTPSVASPAAAPLSYPSTPFALIDPQAVRGIDAEEISTEASAPAQAPIEGASLPASPR